jgi:branched-chain amino acid transport system substrate-binding protein
VIVDTSGPTSSLGIAGRNGMQLAVEQTNAAGGIHGRPIELLQRDDGFNLQQASQAASELINAKVDAAFGPMTSLIAEQLAPQFTDAGILLMGGTPLSPLLAGRDDQFFRILSHASPDAQGIARHLQQQLGIGQVTVLIEESNHTFTRPWLADFQRYFASEGGSIGLTIAFTRDAQTDFAALARQALAGQPRAVVLISNALDTAMLATQLRQQNPQLVLATPAWAAADALLEMGGRAVEGIITGQAYDLSDQSPTFLAFKQAYQQRFGQSVDTAAVTAYNATQVLLTALRERQPQESPKQTLLRIRHFASLQQPIDLDEFGDGASRFYLMVVRQGRFVNAE